MKKKIYENRELSWLSFNERVLKEAKREEMPLCERLGFVSIYQTNLDEFFMVRVGTLHDQIGLFDENIDEKSNMTSAEQIKAICHEVRKLNKKKEKIYASLMEGLAEYGVSLTDLNNLTGDEEKYYRDLFEKSLKPLLTPIVVGKRQTFPFLKNEEIYAVTGLKTKSGKYKLGIISSEGSDIQRCIPVKNKPGQFVLADDLILHFAYLMFPSYQVKEKSLIRITRSADISLEKVYDEEFDYRAEMENVIKMRKRLNPVRIELTEKLSDEAIEKICQYLVLETGRIFYNKTPLDFGFFKDFKNYLKPNHPELFFPKITHNEIDSHDMIAKIKNKDVLLTYPFETMHPFIELLKQAAENEDVTSISITLYRVSKVSEVVSCLILAAKEGKKVNVLVELKARFDEQNNIEWSKRLEDAGCNVIYGWPGLKVHSKLCLIALNENGKKSYITQVGTGNYNEITSNIYTDMSLMTYNQEIGAEAAMVFDKLFSGKLVESTKHLLVAPECMKQNIIDMIDTETERAKRGEDAYIGAKLNSMTDTEIMGKLVKASKAGVHIDLIIRGICCLTPGVEGLTENIHIISIVGQYLEHSRIYLFGSPERRKMYISSADWMTRNMDRRVEVACPVYDPDIRDRIQTMFDIMLADSVKARVKGSDRKYRKQKKDYVLVSQEYFAENSGLNTPETLKAAKDLLAELKNKEEAETEN